jgi:hypothetical protein
MIAVKDVTCEGSKGTQLRRALVGLGFGQSIAKSSPTEFRFASRAANRAVVESYRSGVHEFACSRNAR